MKIAALIPFSLLLGALAGCSQNNAEDGGGVGVPGAVRLYDTLNITQAFATEWSSNHFVFAATEPMNVTVTMANGRPAELPDSWESCGWLEYDVTEGAGGRVGDRLAWGESRGHAAFYASGGSRASSINNSRANDDLALGVNAVRRHEISLAAGQHIDLTVTHQTTPGAAFEPYVNLTATGARLALLSADAIGFSCGANLSRFSGDFVDSGLPGAWLTRIDAAFLTKTTVNGSEGTFLFALNPEFGGQCNISARLDGRSLNRSLGEDRSCVISWDDGPGALELRIEDTLAYESTLTFVILDR